MTPDEFKEMALVHLDRCDEADMEKWATEQPDADWFADLYTRWGHARAAFPGMSFEEFGKLDHVRQNPPKRGRPKQGLTTRSETPIALAARDADRIKAFAAVIGYSFEGIEYDYADLAAERHDVDPVDVAERLRRGADRNPHRQ